MYYSGNNVLRANAEECIKGGACLMLSFFEMHEKTNARWANIVERRQETDKKRKKKGKRK